MTILGFYERSLEDSEMRNLSLRSELTDDDSSKFVYGLYFNQKNPERQEVMSVKKQE